MMCIYRFLSNSEFLLAWIIMKTYCSTVPKYISAWCSTPHNVCLCHEASTHEIGRWHRTVIEGLVLSDYVHLEAEHQASILLPGSIRFSFTMDVPLEHIKSYIGRPVSDLPTPSVILSKPVLEQNIQSTLQDVRDLSIAFRPHVKTLKVSDIAV